MRIDLLHVSALQEVRGQYREFLLEVARGAEHSRTGRSIPPLVLKELARAEEGKSEELETLRLKNILLRREREGEEGGGLLWAKERERERRGGAGEAPVWHPAPQPIPPLEFLTRIHA